MSSPSALDAQEIAPRQKGSERITKGCRRSPPILHSRVADTSNVRDLRNCAPRCAACLVRRQVSAYCEAGGERRRRLFCSRNTRGCSDSRIAVNPAKCPKRSIPTPRTIYTLPHLSEGFVLATCSIIGERSRL